MYGAAITNVWKVGFRDGIDYTPYVIYSIISIRKGLRGRQISHLSVRLPFEYPSFCEPTNEHLSHDPKISAPLPLAARNKAAGTNTLTISSDDKPGVHDLGRSLFIGGIKSFQMHLIVSEYNRPACANYPNTGVRTLTGYALGSLSSTSFCDNSIEVGLIGRSTVRPIRYNESKNIDSIALWCSVTCYHVAAMLVLVRRNRGAWV